MRTRLTVLVALIFALAGSLAAKDRVWQTGTWLEVHVTRPKVVFGLQPSPGPGLGPGAGAASPMEVRTYVIETAEFRLELKDTAPSNVPLIDAVVGDSVTFALEKDTLYIKDARGRDRSFHVTKKTPKK